MFFVFKSIPDRYKTEMCKRVVSEEPFVIIYSPYRYKTQKMCDEAADDYLGALNFFTDRFVTSKMLEKFHDTLLANDDILFFNEDFNTVTFFVNEMDILVVDLDKINLDEDNNFDEDDFDTIIHVRLLAWQ